ncbi:probable nucleoredoxin 1 isoform X2 [Pistacia vera]|uniref:probable nucleoredoxin 1 isoform X2 n=1 Tax=Pistacia vera TaxID=55513 RepID=UPI0012633806|nr:probable nucleoredoxin 1 isoform X2 [Pistacia vera]
MVTVTDMIDGVLIRSEATVDELEDKIIGLYFASASCPRSQRFTPILVQTYNEIISKDKFEIILVSLDNDEESFHGYFFTMSWLAIPHSNETARHGLKSLYSVQETPHLIILSKEGDVMNSIGHFLVAGFGSLAYPFTKDTIKELKDEEEAQKKNQTLRTILATPS